MKHNFRINQRVLRVRWKQGVPFLKFGIVTKVTASSYYVDKAPKPARWWANWEEAIRAEYLSLFMDWDSQFGKLRRGVTGFEVEDTVCCVCELRRLERKLRRRQSKK